MDLAQQEAAFKQLFAAQYEALCRHALTFLKDEHAAEDVVQNTFIRFWETKKELVASPDARFYLITAVRNNCISELRKSKTSPIKYTDAEPEPEPEVHFTALQQREEATEQSRRISVALDKLPPKCREVFLLIKLHGASYKAAAESLGISVKTVEAQMGKAVKILREGVSIAVLILSILPKIFFTGAVGVFITACVL
jgi:RNA polymerase sigma-70 factor (ECF subfamily)